MNHPADHEDRGYPAQPRPGVPSTGGARRTLVWVNVALSLLIVVALVFCGIALLGNNSSSVRTPSRTLDVEVGERIRDRVGDPEKLRDSELFQARSFTIDLRRYTVSGISHTEQCEQTAHGDLVPRALEVYGCNQVLRATLLDESGQFAATWGIANLADAPGAAALDSLLNSPSDNGGFTLLQTPSIDNRLEARKSASAHRQTGHYVLFVIVVKLEVSDYDVNDPAIAQIATDAIGHLDAVVTDHASDG